MATPSSIPDSRLGLTSDEVHTLRQHQQLALSNAGGSSSSRTTSHASSQGRLLLDPASLAALSHHFDRVMGAISQRLQLVSLLQTRKEKDLADIRTAEPTDRDSRPATVGSLTRVGRTRRRRDCTLQGDTATD